MAVAIALLLVLAQGAADFGAAGVSGSEATAATMEIDLFVILNDSDGPVVAHLLLPGEPDEVKPMLKRGGREWGTILEVRRADWRVVFEDVAGGVLSEEMSLTELGLDAALLGVAERPTPPPTPLASPPWMWLGVAAVALLLAVGVARRGGRRVRPRHLRR